MSVCLVKGKLDLLVRGTAAFRRGCAARRRAARLRGGSVSRRCGLHSRVAWLSVGHTAKIAADRQSAADREKGSDGYRSKFETGMSVSVFFNFEHRYFGMGSVFNRALDDSVFWY